MTQNMLDMVEQFKDHDIEPLVNLTSLDILQSQSQYKLWLGFAIVSIQYLD